MESPVACSLCDFRSPSLSLWLSHLRHVHRSDTAITIKCPVGDCGAVYDKVNSFCSHMYRSHRVLCTTDTDASANNKQTTASPSSIVHPMSIETGTEVSDDLQHDIDQLLETDGFEQRKKSSLYLLQIKEERMVSQAAVNDIVQGCQEVFQHTIGRIKAGVKRKLSSSGIDPTEVSGLDELFTSVTDPFDGLETCYHQEKFVSEKLGCIVSIKASVQISVILPVCYSLIARSYMNEIKIFCFL